MCTQFANPDSAVIMCLAVDRFKRNCSFLIYLDPRSTTKNGVFLRNFSTVVFVIFYFLWYLEGSRYIMIYNDIYIYIHFFLLAVCIKTKAIAANYLAES